MQTCKSEEYLENGTSLLKLCENEAFYSWNYEIGASILRSFSIFVAPILVLKYSFSPNLPEQSYTQPKNTLCEKDDRVDISENLLLYIFPAAINGIVQPLRVKSGPIVHVKAHNRGGIVSRGYACISMSQVDSGGELLPAMRI